MADIYEKFGLGWIEKGEQLHRERKLARQGRLDQLVSEEVGEPKPQFTCSVAKPPGTVSGGAKKTQRMGGAESFIEVAGKPLVAALKRSPEQKAKLHDLLPDLGLRLDEALPIVQHLLDTQQVERLQDDPVAANYLLKAK